MDPVQQQKDGLAIAFLGNSFTYYNDLPNMLAALLASASSASASVTVGRCLRGGVGLKTLLTHGGERGAAWNTPRWADAASTVPELLQKRRWHFVVLQQNSRNAAGDRDKCAAGLAAVQEFIPELRATGATVILYKTWAYRSPTAVETNYGDHDTHLARLTEGYGAYEQALAAAGIPCRIAPVGDAWALARRQNAEVWHDLFCADDYHPSPTGTYLSSCVLFSTITGLSPCGLTANVSQFLGVDAWLGKQERVRLKLGAYSVEGPLRDMLQGFAAEACGMARQDAAK